MQARGLRVEVDDSDDRMQKKIRNAQLQKVPFMVIAGDQDVEAGAVSFRYRDGHQDNGVPVDGGHRAGGSGRGVARAGLSRDGSARAWVETLTGRGSAGRMKSLARGPAPGSRGRPRRSSPAGRRTPGPGRCRARRQPRHVVPARGDLPLGLVEQERRATPLPRYGAVDVDLLGLVAGDHDEAGDRARRPRPRWSRRSRRRAAVTRSRNASSVRRRSGRRARARGARRASRGGRARPRPRRRRRSRGAGSGRGHGPSLEAA